MTDDFCIDQTKKEILLLHVKSIKKSKGNSRISKKKMGISQLFLNISLMENGTKFNLVAVPRK